MFVTFYSQCSNVHSSPTALLARRCNRMACFSHSLWWNSSTATLFHAGQCHLDECTSTKPHYLQPNITVIHHCRILLLCLYFHVLTSEVCTHILGHCICLCAWPRYTLSAIFRKDMKCANKSNLKLLHPLRTGNTKKINPIWHNRQHIRKATLPETTCKI